MAESIKVMIVDDSAVVRQVVAKALAEAPGIEVVGVANDPLFALDRMRNDWPDVLVVDIEMPRMDGIAFVRKIMAERPTPVIICSSLAEPGLDRCPRRRRSGGHHQAETRPQRLSRRLGAGVRADHPKRRQGPPAPEYRGAAPEHQRNRPSFA